MALRGDGLAAELAGHNLVYLSGITLSLFDLTGRDSLMAVLGTLRRQGAKIAFDGNYRPRGWPDQCLIPGVEQCPKSRCAAARGRSRSP
jgi:sugar/nucleoside kinase (ribokinase family)